MNELKYKLNIFSSPSCLSFMTYKYCPVVDNIINKHLDSGIKNIWIDNFYIHIKFNNGKSVSLWGRERYHKWLSKGYAGDSKWEDARPKRSTMRRLKGLIKNYFKNNKK